LRQAGIVAAAANYALDHHIERLQHDHDNARLLAESIAQVDGLQIDLATVESNLVFFEIDGSAGTTGQLVQALDVRGVKVLAVGERRIRACTHLDITQSDAERAAEAIRACLEAGLSSSSGEPDHPYAYR
jgi:threonine aldolase